MSGTLKADNRTIQTGLVIYNATLIASINDAIAGPRRLPRPISSPSSRRMPKYRQRVANGLNVGLRDINFAVDSSGTIVNTTAMTVTLPTHMRIGFDGIDPVYSYKRARTVVLYTTNFDGRYTDTTFYTLVKSNLSYSAPGADESQCRHH
jgi:hypothetical protein